VKPLLPVPLPWHQTLWQGLIDRHSAQCLPHALLLKGPKGGGKVQLAQAFAAYLLCQNRTSSSLACGQCKSCMLIQAGTHPDYVFLEPEAGGKAIKIDQIRQLVEFVNKTAQLGGMQVVVIAPAEAMNVAASNALLKSLEEPTAQTQFLLVSHMSSALMATIRSRCQTLSVALPHRDAALAWLKGSLPSQVDCESLLNASSGAPLLAAQLLETDWLELRLQLFDSLMKLKQGQGDAVKLASEWKDKPSLMLVTWWQSLVLDCLKWLPSNNVELLANNDQQNVIIGLANLVSVPGWFEFNDRLETARRQLMSSANPNVQLLWEDLLIGWGRLR